MGYKDKFNLKKKILSKINRKITLLFLIVTLIAPSIAILYLFNVSTTITGNQGILLKTVALIVVVHRMPK